MTHDIQGTTNYNSFTVSWQGYKDYSTSNLGPTLWNHYNNACTKSSQHMTLRHTHVYTQQYSCSIYCQSISNGFQDVCCTCRHLNKNAFCTQQTVSFLGVSIDQFACRYSLQPPHTEHTFYLNQNLLQQVQVFVLQCIKTDKCSKTLKNVKINLPQIF